MAALIVLGGVLAVIGVAVIALNWPGETLIPGPEDRFGHTNTVEATGSATAVVLGYVIGGIGVLL